MTETVAEPGRLEIQGPDGMVLKQLVPEDAKHYFDLVDFNRDHLSQHDDKTADKYQSIDDVRNSIEKPNPNRLRFGIWVGEGMVGSINLDTTEEEIRPEVGYWIGAEYIGHGYAAKALQTIIPFALARPGVERLFAQVYKRNEASRKTLEKCGFKQTDDDGYWLDFELTKPDHINHLSP